MIIPILNILILINCAYPSGIWCRTARIWPSCWGSHCAQSFPNGSWTFWSISFVTFKHRRYSLNSFAAMARKVSKKLINNYIDFFLYFFFIFFWFCCTLHRWKLFAVNARGNESRVVPHVLATISVRITRLFKCQHARDRNRDIYIYFLTRMRPNLGWLDAFSHQFENKQTVCHFRAEQSLRKNRMKYRTCVYTLYIYEYI